MAKYTSVDLLYKRDPQIGSVSDLTSAQLADAFVAHAEAEVDSYLGRSYTLPISAAGVTFPLLEAVATDITAYRVYSQRIFTQEQLKDSTWPERLRYARDILKDIASGATLLIDSSGQLLADRTDIAEVWSSTQDYVPTFSELDPEYAQLDSDKADDLSDERSAKGLIIE